MSAESELGQDIRWLNETVQENTEAMREAATNPQEHSDRYWLHVFAGKAMKATIANPALLKAAVLVGNQLGISSTESVAKTAKGYATAMLAELHRREVDDRPETVVVDKPGQQLTPDVLCPTCGSHGYSLRDRYTGELVVGHLCLDCGCEWHYESEDSDA